MQMRAASDGVHGEKWNAKALHQESSRFFAYDVTAHECYGIASTTVFQPDFVQFSVGTRDYLYLITISEPQINQFETLRWGHSL